MTADRTEGRVGVDVGGTFTDVVAVRDGELHVHKTASTPDAPDEGVLDGLADLRDEGTIEPGRVGSFAHGTTVATNAVLEREWADAALVTTAGFRDALEIGRQARPDVYDLRAAKPEPVVPRDRRFEVPERLDERGRVVTGVDEAAVREVADRIADAGVESVAVSLLFSFENDDHERRVRDLLCEEGVEVPIALSSSTLPEIREYERTLATALDAGLTPVMEGYLGRLETRLRGAGVPASPRVMASSGGLIDAASARERPVETLLSGPAAGVRGASYVADLAGHADVITMDMGGTSCDVSLVTGGDPVVSTDVEVGPYPVALPMVDVHTVGAGGGSIARIDDGGAVRVGPASAGARPGPICYGRGGTEPTVTDAHYLLGRIDPGGFLGEFAVDRGAVEAGFEPIADALGSTVEEAARGVLAVANASTERALRVVSVERGHDPRAFALVAYGGAGPLHASALADALDVPRVIVPRAAGVLSAVGLLASDVVYDFGASSVRPFADLDADAIAERFEAFERRGRERLADGGFADDRIRFERRLDVRYLGQSFDLPVSVPDGAVDDRTLEAVAERFHERHRERYGHASPSEPLELVTVRLRARGVVDPPPLSPADAEGSPDDAIRETRRVVFEEGLETPAYERAALPVGASVDGPAIVEGPESTVVVRPGQRVDVDEYGSLIVEVAP